MNKVLKIISSIVVLLSITVIFVFRTVPAGKLWNDYSVLYVPTTTDDSIILKTLNDSDIKDVVSLSNQYLPLNVSEDSLEYSMYKANIDNESNQYIKNRNSYFFDKSQQYRIYYIPRQYENKINKAISLLAKSHIPCGLDANAGYPILFPILVLLLGIIILIFSKNKLLFSIGAIIPILYVFCNPFFPVAISISLLLLCILFISNIWKRKGAVSYLRSFIFIPAVLIASLLCGFSSSIRSGFMFLVAIAGAGSSLISYYWIEDYFYNKKSFIPINIRSAKQVSIFSDTSKSLYIFFGIGALLLLGVFFITSTGAFTSNSSNIELPSSSSEQSQALPQFEDYYEWAWNFTTYPYKSLNTDDNSTTIKYPTFVTEDGIIKENDFIMTFDNDFKLSIYDNINKLQFNSIEKVMKSEGENFIAGYNTSSSYHIDLFGIILIIICYLILLFIYFSIIITKKGTNK